jgi:hypothetical protein
MHLHGTGVVRRKFQKGIALTADRYERSVALEVFDCAGDFLARGIRIEALVNVLDVEEAVALRAKERDDGLMKFGGERKQRLLGSPRNALRVSFPRRRDAFRGQAAANGTDRFGKAVQHRLRAKLVVQRVAMYAERFRSLRDVAAAGRHCRDDVLSFEGFDSLFECDAVTD